MKSLNEHSEELNENRFIVNGLMGRAKSIMKSKDITEFDKLITSMSEDLYEDGFERSDIQMIVARMLEIKLDELEK